MRNFLIGRRYSLILYENISSNIYKLECYGYSLTSYIE
nr:MAG TPA: hypothetical protein [Bacteriophage sp.]